MSQKAVFGIVRSETEAERVVADLRTEGFAMNDVSVLFPNQGSTRDFAYEQGTKASEGAVAGGSAGGALGGALGLLAGIGAITLPGIGLLIAAGPLLAALSAAALGAAVGSIAGGLVGFGIPDLHAKLYEGKLRDGNILIAVHAANGHQIEAAKGILHAHQAEHVCLSSEAHVPRDQEPTQPNRLQPALLLAQPAQPAQPVLLVERTHPATR